MASTQRIDAAVAELEFRHQLAAMEFRTALALAHVDFSTALSKCRLTLEYIMHEIYDALQIQCEPGAKLAELIDAKKIRPHVPARIRARMNFIREIGNIGSHADEDPSAGVAIQHDDCWRAIEELVVVAEWFSLFMASFSGEGVSATPRDRTLSEPLRYSLQRLKKMINELTREQFDVLTHIRRIRRSAISGCAGSGKTILAMEHAVRLEQAGLQVLLLCHSPPLADYIRDALIKTEVAVFDFGAWVRKLNDQSDEGGNWTNFDEPTTADLESAFDKLSQANSFDAVIVDEAQDFAAEWWLLIESALAEPASGRVTLFFDNNQALLPLRSTYPIETAQQRLAVNCRNAVEIGSQVNRLHDERVQLLPSLTGGRFSAKLVDRHEIERHIAIGIAEITQMGIREFCIVTTENGRAEDSRFSGAQFSVAGSFCWQDAVRHAFRRVNRSTGLPRNGNGGPAPRIEFPHLSESPSPTASDIDRIVEFATALCRAQFIDLSARQHLMAARIPLTRRFKWGVVNGESRLLGPGTLHPSQTVLFFIDRDWAQEVPGMLRLTLTPWHKASEETEIKLYTVASIKGLEMDGIITVAPKGEHNLRRSIYVALSRARLFQRFIIAKEISSQVPEFM